MPDTQLPGQGSANVSAVVVPGADPYGASLRSKVRNSAKQRQRPRDGRIEVDQKAGRERERNRSYSEPDRRSSNRKLAQC